jgi:hypothetical protein
MKWKEKRGHYKTNTNQLVLEKINMELFGGIGSRSMFSSVEVALLTETEDPLNK